MEKLLHSTRSGKGNAGRISALILFIVLTINLSGQKLQTTLMETWKTGAWQNSEKMTYSYDGNGYEISNLYQEWDQPSTSWLNKIQTVNTINPDGTVNNSVVQEWDNAWETVQKTSNTYNAAKKVLTSVSELWTGTAWMNFSRTTNTYNGNGYLTNNLVESWNFISSSWSNLSQINYTYNGNGTEHQVVNQTWNTGTSAWDNLKRSTHTYDASDRVLTTTDETWSSGNWVNQSLSTNTWAANGSLSKTLFQTWNTVSTSWVNEGQSDYSYYPNGNINQIIDQDWLTNEWVNAERITYTYGTSTGRVEIKDEKSISVYPNPADDFITIRSDFNFNSSKYSLEDQAGKQVRTGRLTDRITTLDISGLADGLYILRVGDTRQHIFKIIKK